jgi:uncharacterized protein
VKFVADGMLGSLTRWLRMLGQDIVYSATFDDSQLLELAKREERSLLTKDFELYKRAISKNLDAIYIEGKSEPERLAEVAQRYGVALEIDMDKSRCPVCNTPLKVASKEELRGEIKENTYTYYNNFWKCPNCGQIYWQGAHRKHIQSTLTQAQQNRLQKN